MKKWKLKVASFTSAIVVRGYKCAYQKFHGYRWSGASLTSSGEEPIHSSRETKHRREGVVERAGRNRRTLNGDIGYPCLFSLCFQLPLAAGAVVHPRASSDRSRRKAGKTRNGTNSGKPGEREGETVTGVEKKKEGKSGSPTSTAGKTPLWYARELAEKNTGRNKNIDRGAGSFNFVRFNYFLN